MTLAVKCPKCGADTECGFGLAFGGYGAYEYCAGNTDCDWFHKTQEDDTTDPADKKE